MGAGSLGGGLGRDWGGDLGGHEERGVRGGLCSLGEGGRGGGGGEVQLIPSTAAVSICNRTKSRARKSTRNPKSRNRYLELEYSTVPQAQHFHSMHMYLTTVTLLYLTQPDYVYRTTKICHVGTANIR